MEILVANVDHMKFDIDYALEQQYGALPLPFPGMDSKRYFFVKQYPNLQNTDWLKDIIIDVFKFL